jgi:hypothetical protein
MMIKLSLKNQLPCSNTGQDKLMTVQGQVPETMTGNGLKDRLGKFRIYQIKGYIWFFPDAS